MNKFATVVQVDGSCRRLQESCKAVTRVEFEIRAGVRPFDTRLWKTGLLLSRYIPQNAPVNDSATSSRIVNLPFGSVTNFPKLKLGFVPQ